MIPASYERNGESATPRVTHRQSQRHFASAICIAFFAKIFGGDSPHWGSGEESVFDYKYLRKFEHKFSGGKQNGANGITRAWRDDL